MHAERRAVEHAHAAVGRGGVPERRGAGDRGHAPDAGVGHAGECCDRGEDLYRAQVRRFRAPNVAATQAAIIPGAPSGPLARPALSIFECPGAAASTVFLWLVRALGRAYTGAGLTSTTVEMF